MSVGHLCRACGASLPIRPPVVRDLLYRYLFTAPILVVGLMVALARWNDL